MAFFAVKAGDRVQGHSAAQNKSEWHVKVGVCKRTWGMLVYVVWDGETEESRINAFFLEPEGKEV
jgi:hypothetical protein